MTDLSDWVWWIVAGIWVVTRILPRLFRSKTAKVLPEEPEQQDQPGEPEAETARDAQPPTLSRPESFLPRLDERGLSKGDEPPPIEPS